MIGGFGEIYICHKSAFDLFEDIVLKIELLERSDCLCLCKADGMVAQHAGAVSSHFCHILSHLSPSRFLQSERWTARQMSRCNGSVLYIHTIVSTPPAMAWHGNSILGGVVFFFFML